MRWLKDIDRKSTRLNSSHTDCFEVEEFDDDIRDILYEHEYIINTSGINKIEDVFEIYKEKQTNWHNI